MAQPDATDASSGDPRRRTKPTRAELRKKAHCPLCDLRLFHAGIGGQKVRHCPDCGGTVDQHVACPACESNSVWVGHRGKVCEDCGHDLQPNA